MKKYLIPIALVIGLIAIVGFNLWLALNDNQKHAKLMDSVLSVCVFETKKNLTNPEAATFDLDNSYVISTNNPNIWIAYVTVTAHNALNAKLTKGISCRIHKINNNLQADTWHMIDI